jgi:predicted ATPase
MDSQRLGGGLPMMADAATWTPDQRVRVFVSAEERELAAERAAVRAAIESLRLHPVMIEAGARSYAPHELSRASLEQCHVFVGVYGLRDGPTAPGASASTLHDEYHHARVLPRLLYVQRAERARDPGLAALLELFRVEGHASYASFRDAEELRRMVQTDLAALLTERFLEGGGAPSVRRPSTRPRLPRPTATLIGRHREIGEVRALMTQHRIVTITGPGGTGKTRLALEAMRLPAEETEGPFFVDLSGSSRGDLVVPVIEQALGIVAPGGRRGVEGLADVIAARRVVLVLDNCEQVIDEVAAVASALLSMCPALRLLCTSRQPLRIYGEQLYPLAPLEAVRRSPDGGDVPGDAMELLESRARDLVPDFRIGPENFEAVRRICEELDGLPLAIELAAARLRLLSPEGLAKRLDARFSLLSGGPRDLSGRQRALAATIAWSVDLLSERERALFSDVAAFHGGFETDALQHVAGWDEIEAEDVLGELVEKSLLGRDDASPERYRMLHSVSEYARWRMSESQRDDLASRHLRWLVELTTDVGPRLFGHDAAVHFARLVREQDNVRAALTYALDRGDGEAALSIAGDLGWFWYRRGYVQEGRRWLEAALAADAASAHPKRSLALVSLAGLYYLEGDLSRATVLAGRGREEAARFDDVITLGRALTYHSYFMAMAGDVEKAAALVAEARELGAVRGAAHVWAEASTAWGQLLRLRGDAAGAERVLVEAADTARESGNRWLEGSALWIAAKVALDRDDARAAIERLRYILSLQAGEGDVTSTLVGLHTMAGALASAGRAARGAMLLGAVAAIGGRIGYYPERMDAIDGPRTIERVRGALGEAAFAEAFADGERLGLEDALVLAGV